MRINQDESSGGLKLSGALELLSIDALCEALIECVDRGPSPSVDLSDVEACDTASLQLLYAAQKSAAQSGKSFRITAISEKVGHTAAELGLPLEGLIAGGLPDVK